MPRQHVYHHHQLLPRLFNFCRACLLPPGNSQHGGQRPAANHILGASRGDDTDSVGRWDLCPDPNLSRRLTRLPNRHRTYSPNQTALFFTFLLLLVFTVQDILYTVLVMLYA